MVMTTTVNGVAAVGIPRISASRIPVANVRGVASIGTATVRTGKLATPSALVGFVNLTTPVISTTGFPWLETLVERFSIADSSVWDYNSPGNISVVAGKLRIKTSSSYYTLYSKFEYRLRDSFAYLEVDPARTGTQDTYVLFTYGTNRVGFRVSAGGLGMIETVSGTDSVTTIAYDPVQHRWLRFGMVGTTLTWQTSPDGSSWTVRRTKATALNPTNGKLMLQSGFYGSEVSPPDAVFDNLNYVLPPVLPDPVPAPQVGWWLEVYDLTDPTMLLCKLQAEAATFKFLDGVSQVGVGTVTLPEDSWVIQDLLPDGTQNVLPNGKAGRTLVEQPYYWVVFDHGVPRFRFIPETIDRQKADPTGLIETVLSGSGHAIVISWGVALPTDVNASAKSRVFMNTNWATAWLTLLNEAQERGSIPRWLVPTFDQNADSNGVPWIDYGNYEIKPGTDLLASLNEFAESIAFDWHVDTNGRLVVAGDYGTDRSDVVRFYEGHDIFNAEDHYVGSGVKSDVYLEGGDGRISRATDTTTRDMWGYREVYVQASAALGELAGDIYARGTLAQTQRPVFERKFVVDPYPIDRDGVSLGRRAFVDYKPGDTIGYGQPGEDTTFRLLDVGIEVDRTGEVAEEIVVNARREQFAEKVRRLLKTNLGGNYDASTTSGNDMTGGSSAIDGAAVGDTSVPGIPTFTALSSVSSQGSDGAERAQVSLTWDIPMNTDATPIVDGDIYEVGYRINGTTEWIVSSVTWDQTNIQLDGLIPNTAYQFRIRAVDYASPKNYGAWSAPTLYTTVIDSVAPPTPATPGVAASFISVQITHTLGLSTGGTFNLPRDLNHLEVHGGTVLGFATSPSTLLGKLTANKGMLAGNIPAVGTFPLASTTITYFKVIAVDNSGNRSPASGPAQSTALLIPSQNIDSLVASKIATGTMTATVTVAGTFQTAASGQRGVFDMNGIRFYNSSGSNTINFDTATGNGLVTGILQTALTGQRIVIDSSGFGTIYFYPPTGTTDFSFINAPEQNSVGVNSGKNGTSYYSRMWVRPTVASMEFLTASQEAAGGNVSVHTTGVDITGTPNDRIYMNITDGAYGQLAQNVNFIGKNGAQVVTETGAALFGVVAGDKYASFPSSGNSVFRHGSDSRVELTGTTVLLYGVVRIPSVATTGLSANMYMAPATGQIYYNSSSRLVKEQIEDADEDKLADGVLNLRLRTFYDREQYEEAGGETEGISQQLGVVAEEVLEDVGDYLADLLIEHRIMPDGTEGTLGFNHGQIAYALVALAKRQQADIETIKSMLGAQ